MDHRNPTTAVTPRQIFLFVLIAVSLGLLTGNPDATYSMVADQSAPGAVALILLLLFGLSPLIAVVILVRRLGIAGGIRPFLYQRFRKRTEARWYFVAVGLMPVAFLVTYLVYLAFNEPVPIDPAIIAFLLLEILLLGFVYNIVENYGWRGFLQEALQSHVPAVGAWLLVGVVWALWHVSLLLPGGQFEGFPVASFFLVITGEAVVIGWLYNVTGGSVLHAALMHTSFNASFGALVTLMILAEMGISEFYWMTAVVIWSLAALIILLSHLKGFDRGFGPAAFP